MSRVLFISPQPFFQWRGSPIRVGFDVRALAGLGYDVDFLTLPVGEEMQIPGVRIVRVPNLFRVAQVPIGPSAVKLAFDYPQRGFGVYKFVGLVPRAFVHGANLLPAPVWGVVWPRLRLVGW